MTVSAKNYVSRSTTPPARKPFSAVLRLQPIPVEVDVVSSLTKKPMASTVSAAGGSTEANAGRATVYNVGPGDKITVSSDGYGSRTNVVPASRTVAVTLVAGPKATAIYLSQQMIAQNYAVQVAFVHPDELKFVSRTAVRSALKQADDDGYGVVKWTFKGLTMLPSWRFPGCNGQSITYHHVAAIQFSAVNSAPKGGSQSTNGVEHLVESGGHWDWFPVVPGCE